MSGSYDFRFDATQGTAGLKVVLRRCVMHYGVITDQSKDILIGGMLLIEREPCKIQMTSLGKSPISGN